MRTLLVFIQMSTVAGFPVRTLDNNTKNMKLVAASCRNQRKECTLSSV